MITQTVSISLVDRQSPPIVRPPLINDGRSLEVNNIPGNYNYGALLLVNNNNIINNSLVVLLYLL